MFSTYMLVWIHSHLFISIIHIEACFILSHRHTHTRYTRSLLYLYKLESRILNGKESEDTQHSHVSQICVAHIHTQKAAKPASQVDTIATIPMGDLFQEFHLPPPLTTGRSLTNRSFSLHVMCPIVFPFVFAAHKANVYAHIVPIACVCVCVCVLSQCSSHLIVHHLVF